MLRALCVFCSFSAFTACHSVPEGSGEEPWNVILVTSDGTRWQEVFAGADEKLLNKQDGGVRDVEGVKKAYWRDTPEARREALMPFLWGVVAKEGQIFGNGPKGSVARLTNGLKFSYPGYNEILTGRADPRVDSNKKIPNPNVTVLEWLNRRPGFEGRVAAFCSWDVFPSILNRERSGIFIDATEPDPNAAPGSRAELLQALKTELPDVLHGSIFDALVFQAARDFVRARRPRVLYVALGEPDEWAHAVRYDLYLDSIHRVDACLRALWDMAQSMPDYRGRTSMVVTTDHGRGDAPTGWKSHGKDVKGAEFIWAAALGPRVPPLGERANVEEVTQSQVAATLAALVGEDWCAAEPQATRPLPIIASGPREGRR